MTDEELKKKIVDILVNCKSDCDGNPYIENCREQQLADALIEAGIGDVKEEKEKLEGRYYWEVAREKFRAERAERALINEIKTRIKMTGDYEALVYTYYGNAIQQAEKELAEERKDD